MPCVCDTFAAYDRLAFSKHCTNPLAEVGKQSDALPLFSRCHLATSRLPCGVQVPPFFEKTGGEKTFKTMQNVSKCAKSSMSDKTLTYTTIYPTWRFCRRSMSAKLGRPEICISVSLGRSSIAGGGSLFPPCLRAFSPSGAQSPAPLQTYRRPLSDECGNPRRSVCGWRFPALPFRSRRCQPHTSTLLIAAHANPLHPSGVRASCGRARPSTLSTLARRAPNFRRSDVASCRAQSARGTMRNARGIV